MTERLYYTDSYLTAFPASILEIRPSGWRSVVYLDRTAFYPASGGQPFDTGHIGPWKVVEVLDEGDRIAHLVEGAAAECGPVECRLDWERRFDHMQQHTGQHLLSAVFETLFRYPTLSFHLGSEASTIDLGTAQLSAGQAEAAEERANELAFENRPVTVAFYSDEQAATAGLRKPAGRAGSVRVVEITGLDRSACGGTHVRATGEIGPILIRRLDRVRGNVRVEFCCGLRAVRRARGDYNALARVAQLFSAPLEQAPVLAAAQADALKTAEKARRKLEAELARWRGRDLSRSTAADAQGRRVHQETLTGEALEDRRALAQSFAAAGSRAVFLAATERPPALLLALSDDLGLHAGQIVRGVVEPLGGRGGGSAQLAQASLPGPEKLAEAFHALLAKLTAG